MVARKIISLPTMPTTPDHIGYVAKILLRAEWLDTIFANYDKMAKFSVPLLCSLLPKEKNPSSTSLLQG